MINYHKMLWDNYPIAQKNKLTIPGKRLVIFGGLSAFKIPGKNKGFYLSCNFDKRVGMIVHLF